MTVNLAVLCAGDVTPKTAAEEGVAIGVMVLGVLLFGYVIGAVTDLIRVRSRHVLTGDLAARPVKHAAIRGCQMLAPDRVCDVGQATTVLEMVTFQCMNPALNTC